MLLQKCLIMRQSALFQLMFLLKAAFMLIDQREKQYLPESLMDKIVAMSVACYWLSNQRNENLATPGLMRAKS